jgi:hypothetical protein
MEEQLAARSVALLVDRLESDWASLAAVLVEESLGACASPERSDRIVLAGCVRGRDQRQQSSSGYDLSIEELI